MATPVKTRTGSKAGTLAEELTRRASAYPSGTAFLDSDTPGMERALLRCVREGRPVVITFPDGEEVFLEARRPWERRRSRLYRAIGRRFGV